MTGLSISLPVVSWVVGPRQYRETYPVPPISTAYGFLLSLVGEFNLSRHHGVKLTTGVLRNPSGRMPAKTTHLRQLRKLKTPGNLSATNNMKPDRQEVMADVTALIWFDSSSEVGSPTLEERVREACEHPERVNRRGPLSLGESCWIVDDIRYVNPELLASRGAAIFRPGRQVNSKPLSLPVVVDHKRDGGTQFVNGQLLFETVSPPLDWLTSI
jgi:CRISPR-associated protein Cas5t